MYKLPSLAILTLFASPALAADWPMWRHDANRSAASPQQLAARLHLQWVRTYPPQKQAWPDQDRMPFDAAYEPVVVGSTLYFGSSRNDALTALDTRTGELKWQFHAEGPIRFAPVAFENRIYFVSDDGCLYCLDGAKGALIWKFRGGPSDRKILGNERLISMWPARGAPVISNDGIIYFAASIWPFMGIFIHALDARTGQVVWTNDGDGSTYMKQPHSTDSFAGIAPQGPMALIGDKLLITGGRSVPACYDRKTGKLIHFLLNENNKKGGGSAVAAIGPVFFNGGYAYELKSGKSLGSFAAHPVLTDDTAYGFFNNACRAFDLKNAEVKPPKWKIADTGGFDFKDGTALIKAGNKLFVGGKNKLIAVSLPLPRNTWPDTSWEHEIAGTPISLVAADDRLFAVTVEGQIYCFGAEAREPVVYPSERHVSKDDAWTKAAAGILNTAGVREGYCICWGVGSGQLIAALARQSNLHIVAIEPDAARARQAREAFIASGIYGDRVAIIHGDPLKVQLPPYVAGLMVSEDLAAAGITADRAFARIAFHSLRPFGGVACLPVSGEKEAEFRKAVSASKLAGSALKSTTSGLLLVREGPLPGSDNWTHEHADAANTRVSMDDLVKAPLGLLWFGGPTNEGVLPRHGHGPQPQVIDGRLIIEGVDQVRAIDIYTGRLLWETRLPGVGAFYDNLAHQPGANAAGTNFISTSEGIYVAYKDGCLRLDPASGKQLGEFKIPESANKKVVQRWGYINVVDDLLIGGADPLFDSAFDAKRTTRGVVSDTDPKPKPKTGLRLPSIRFGQNDNLSASRTLFVMDRKSGKVLWTAKARYAFRHNGICAGGGRLYAIDRLSGAQIARIKDDDELAALRPRISAFDLRSGAPIWETEDNVFGTWLSYSEQHDVLVEAGRVARDTLLDEPKGMRAFRARNGVVMWRDKSYLGPAMIHGDTILKDRSACDLLTGEPKLRPDPLTGEPSEWTWIRNYGCNTPLASRHLMTFRSGAAGYLDLCNDGGTGNFGGFRSSCTNNLIVAGGVLCAPEYTRTCTCSYQNQSSICLVSMPEAEMWTSFGKVGGKAPIRRVGINFGAPGDRKADDGTLWLEYPSVGGLSPPVDAHIVGKELRYFRRHSSHVEGPMNWVASSGVSGLEAFSIKLSKSKDGPKTYSVRLLFAEGEDASPGDRTFDVELQGETVLKGFDVAATAGGRNRLVIREFSGIEANGELKLFFKPAENAKLRRAILCGIEIRADD